MFPELTALLQMCIKCVRHVSYQHWGQMSYLGEGCGVDSSSCSLAQPLLNIKEGLYKLDIAE